jgi:Pup amidohydrolase
MTTRHLNDAHGRRSRQVAPLDSRPESVQPLLRPAPDPSSYSRLRIFGTETEFGDVGRRELPYDEFLANGSRLYLDEAHIEYATPETRDPLSAVLWEKAGELLCRRYARKLYKNNVDSRGTSFGYHENYSTKSSHDAFLGIVPFLATRQIFAGAGHLSQSGFEIAQRTRYITMVSGSDTTEERSLLCTRRDRLSKLSDWRRLHLILGDANMSEIASYLKLGTTGLVLDLAEDRKLPSITGSFDTVVASVHAISRQTSRWRYYAADGKPKATDVQRAYLEAAVREYQGRDAMTDDILRRWDSVLDALDRDPMELVGTLDWVTKKALMDAYAGKHGLEPGHTLLRNIDLQYHDTDRERGLFYGLQSSGRMHRLLTDNAIERAAQKPPSNTRAFARGWIIGALTRKRIFYDEADWDFIEYDPPSGDYEHHGYVRMPDPFKTYFHVVGSMASELKRKRR